VVNNEERLDGYTTKGEVTHLTFTVPAGRYSRYVSSDTRRQLLEAANRVILRDGAGKLTLDAIAKEAKISKGGLLYHFSNKKSLIEAMLEHQFAPFENALARDATSEPGSFTRAVIRNSIGVPGVETQQFEAALIVGLVEEPALLDVVRPRYKTWQDRLEQDGIDPAKATLIRLALDGLYLAELFQLGAPSLEVRQRLFDLMLELAEQEPILASQ
jgi:AcrR family transcriptional regulator